MNGVPRRRTIAWLYSRPPSRVGVVVHYKVGDLIHKGTPLFTVHENDEAKLATARDRVLAAHTLSDMPVQRLPIFYRRVAE